MRRLLQIEFIKVRKYRSFWGVLGIYALIFMLVTGTMGMSESDNPAHAYFSFPDVWLRLAGVASYLNILPGILIIMLIANEYTFRTFRQNVIDGLSRAELIYSKFILIGSVSFLCVSFIFLWGFARGVLAGHFDSLGEVYAESSVLFHLFIQIVGYMSVAAFITFIFKKAAFSILVYLIYMFALEPFIWWRTPDEIDRFFPMSIFGELIPESRMFFLHGLREAPALSPELVMLLACAYIAAFFGLSWLLMERSNL